MARKTRYNRKRSRRNRTRKQRGGGGLDALPLIGAKPEERLNDLRTRWDFKLVMGHGHIIPGVVQVPADTYVLFNSPAGCRAIATGGVPYPDIVIGDDKEAFFAKLGAAHETRSGILDTTTPEVRAALLAGDACYNPELFTDEGFWKLSTKSGKLTPQQLKRTIYGPGEAVNEMSIAFMNNSYEFLILGTYDLPIPNGFYYGSYMTALQSLREDQDRMYTFLSSQTPAAQEKLRKSGEEKTKALDLQVFGRDSPNLHKLYIGQTKTLTQIFSDLPPVPAGQVRLLFVGACRGVQCALPEFVEPLTRAVRRGSLEGDPRGSAAALGDIKSVLNSAMEKFEASRRTGTSSIGVSANVAGVVNQMRKLNNRATPPGQLRPLRTAINKVKKENPEMFAAAKAEYNRQRAEAAAGGAGGE